MESSESNGVVDEKRVRKRSPVERTLVWGGIVVLLLILIVEQQSRSQFHASLDRLESAINFRDTLGSASGIPVAQVEQYIKGFPFRNEQTVLVKRPSRRGENLVESQRQLTFRWPSLFKFYKLGLTINSHDTAILVETFPAGIGT